MPRPRIPASVLRDRGVPMSLLDGIQVSLCYNFASLMALEDEFGSLQGAMEKLQDAESGKSFTNLATIMAAGLAHEVDADGRSLAEIETLANYMDSAELAVYAEAMAAGFAKAFPKVDLQAGAPADPTPQTAPSPGESGTTQPSSPSGSLMASSGL